MNIKELHSFELGDAIKLHDELNPKLFTDDKLRPEVRKQCLIIAQDFIDELGIKDLLVSDITVSGSNAAYTYTDHSDLDLHILVDMSKLPQSDVYKELFGAKKALYNESHDLSIHNVPVELYVQDTNEPVKSLGEYSIVHDKWLKFPVKRKANFDQNAAKAKFDKLQDLIELTIKSNNLDKVNNVLKTIRRYRQSGLEKAGEFGPENLSFKAARKLGLIQQLYDLRDKLHSEQLSIEEHIGKVKDGYRLYSHSGKNLGTYPTKAGAEKRERQVQYFKHAGESVEESKLLDKPTLTVPELAKKHNVSRMDIAKQLDMGIKVELEHTSDRDLAREIALDHLGEDPEYYTKLSSLQLEGVAEGDLDDESLNEGASGYIPSKKEANDPRFKTALSVDVKPDTIQKNAKAMGFKVSRAGIPPLLRK